MSHDDLILALRLSELLPIVGPLESCAPGYHLCYTGMGNKEYGRYVRCVSLLCSRSTVPSDFTLKNHMFNHKIKNFKMVIAKH